MLHHKPHLAENLIQYFHNKELDELYLSVFLKTLAESLINIFIPIYLLELGYSLYDVAVYYFIYFLSVALFMPLGMSFNSKIGIKKTMALGTLFLLIAYYLLNGLNYGREYYWVALIFGASIGIYFSAYHIEFTKITEKKSEGKNLSILKIIAILSGVLGPLFGSLFITEISFHFLFLIVSILLFSSLIPLFITKDKKAPEIRLSFKKLFAADSPSKAIAYQVDGILNIVSGTFWPVFIFLTFSNITFLGGIISLTSLLMVFFVIYLGKKVDQNLNKTMRLGVLTHAPTWIIRLFLLNPVGIFISNFLNSLTISTVQLAFGKRVYQDAENKKDLFHYFLFRDFNLNFGRCIILLLIMLTQNLTWLFILAFFITFLHLINLKKA